MPINTRSRTAVIIGSAALALVTASQPAFASDTKTMEARVAAIRAGKVKLADDRKVCTVDQVTGSYIPRKICHTMKEWKAQGLDPFAK